MRKLLFLFVVTMLSVTAMAQDVIYDKTNDAGVRTVVCSGMDLGVSNGMNVYVALAGFQYKSTIRYSLAVTIGSGHEVEIPDDSKCLLTLGNGKVLELPTVSGGASVLQSIDIEWGDVYQTFRRFGYYNIGWQGTACPLSCVVTDIFLPIIYVSRKRLIIRLFFYICNSVCFQYIFIVAYTHNIYSFVY